jgi:hypothetical protein
LLLLWDFSQSNGVVRVVFRFREREGGKSFVIEFMAVFFHGLGDGGRLVKESLRYCGLSDG